MTVINEIRMAVRELRHRGWSRDAWPDPGHVMTPLDTELDDHHRSPARRAAAAGLTRAGVSLDTSGIAAAQRMR
ncbi:hypothetical protein PV416_19195 [Streptomyces ipomoeae]|uniref:hypothetical protein n=1 Tax=Streptomyces ipomoeae TaxID=103232 RepID=UPI0029B57FBB|nr:hypothetical protein [Streptomyces ipomoeae]MDX2823182.1 hypothetical protein [Streptomyces ipomoeae]MDX2876499.1 hypothetical protein [Streptomyces ipomoeae]